MNTRKALRRAAIQSGFFCFFCLLSIGCLAIFYVSGSRKMFSIGSLALYGWMVNPMPILSCIRCLKIYLKERKDPEAKVIIGKGWIWICVWPVITTVFWLISSVLFVAFTGGV